MNSLQNYKHVIWDWNGTILDDVHMCIDIINDLLEVEKLPTLHIDRYRNIFTIPVENYYREIGFDFEKESFQIVGRRWMDQYESRKYVDAAVNPNSKALIEKVNGAGINQSVLSAYPQNTLDELVGHYNLKEFFDHVVGAGDIYAYGKVDEGKVLMEKLGLQKGEAVLIGDTIHDFEVAEEIGADCILTAEGHQSYDRLNECNCKVVNSLNELL